MAVVLCAVHDDMIWGGEKKVVDRSLEQASGLGRELILLARRVALRFTEEL